MEHTKELLSVPLASLVPSRFAACWQALATRAAARFARLIGSSGWV